MSFKTNGADTDPKELPFVFRVQELCKLVQCPSEWVFQMYHRMLSVCFEIPIVFNMGSECFQN